MNSGIRALASAASPLLSSVLERANGRRGGIILAYHELRARTLRDQLLAVSERYRFVSLSEFVGRLAAQRSTAGLAAITFDDGYGPVVEDAARISQEHGWPMTFYLPTRYLDSREPYWYQELRPLLDRAKDSGAVLAELDASFRRLRSEPEVEAELRRLRLRLHGSEERPAWLETSPPIPWQRVRELSRNDALSFEAHTVNHLALARLDDAAIASEMDACCRRIEEFTGRRVEHFCYPFGGMPEIGDAAPRIARRRFKSATTLLRGRCGAGADLALLPRVPLYDGDSTAIVSLKVATAR
ncbi:MAG: polysaccharide deacetylase family protein [Myxococcota bacterium]